MAFRLIPAEGVLSGHLTGKYTLSGTYIQSPDYVAGVSGWAIFGDGSAEFNNLTLRGTFFGTDFIINANGAFFYSGTPAAGNLIASVASTVTTDGLGNTVRPGGFSAYSSSGSTAFLGTATVSGVAETLLRLFTGVSYESTSFQLINAAQGSGAAAFLSGLVAGPKTNVTGHTDLVGTQFNSANQGGTTTASGQVFYSDAAGTEHVWATWDATGFNIAAGSTTAADPGGGTPAIAETWHTITLDSGWSTSGQTAQYRLLPDGSVQVKGQITHTTAIVSTGVNINGSAPLPASYRPGANAFYKSQDQFRAGILARSTGVLSAFGDGTETLADLTGIYFPGS